MMRGSQAAASVFIRPPIRSTHCMTGRPRVPQVSVPRSDQEQRTTQPQPARPAILPLSCTRAPRRSSPESIAALAHEARPPRAGSEPRPQPAPPSRKAQRHRPTPRTTAQLPTWQVVPSQTVPVQCSRTRSEREQCRPPPRPTSVRLLRKGSRADPTLEGHPECPASGDHARSTVGGVGSWAPTGRRKVRDDPHFDRRANTR